MRVKLYSRIAVHPKKATRVPRRGLKNDLKQSKAVDPLAEKQARGNALRDCPLRLHSCTASGCAGPDRIKPKRISDTLD